MTVGVENCLRVRSEPRLARGSTSLNLFLVFPLALLHSSRLRSPQSTLYHPWIIYFPSFGVEATSNQSHPVAEGTGRRRSIYRTLRHLDSRCLTLNSGWLPTEHISIKHRAGKSLILFASPHIQCSSWQEGFQLKAWRR